LASIAEHFAAALIWASQAKSLVEMGSRFVAMMHLMHPALVEGMAAEIRKVSAADFPLPPSAALLSVGDHFRNILAWTRRGASLSAIGQRGFAVIYVMRQDLIDGATNEKIGRLRNITRQAVNKTIQDFRDTFAGFHNHIMRGDETRLRCRAAHL
jgi:hypothetical protein